MHSFTSFFSSNNNFEVNKKKYKIKINISIVTCSFTIFFNYDFLLLKNKIYAKKLEIEKKLQKNLERLEKLT